MVIGVVADLVSLCPDALHQFRIVLHLLTDEEKGGVDAPLLQAIQQSGRILGRWPVIKGQCQIHSSAGAVTGSATQPVRSRHSTSRGRIRFIASPKQIYAPAERPFRRALSVSKKSFRHAVAFQSFKKL